MKKTVLAISIVSAILALSACSTIPKQAYDNRGQPEALLSVANEQVTVNLNQRNGMVQLADAVSNNQPSGAQLVCSSKLICDRAAEVLDQYNVHYRQVNGASNTVTLTYKNIAARDCENRYIDNHINPYNLNHPTFGCSIAVNQVQMVSDKRQFVDPALLGSYDAQKATQNYDTYQSRTPLQLEQISTSGSGGGGQ